MSFLSDFISTSIVRLNLAYTDYYKSLLRGNLAVYFSIVVALNISRVGFINVEMFIIKYYLE